MMHGFWPSSCGTESGQKWHKLLENENGDDWHPVRDLLRLQRPWSETISDTMPYREKNTNLELELCLSCLSRSLPQWKKRSSHCHKVQLSTYFNEMNSNFHPWNLAVTVLSQSLLLAVGNHPLLCFTMLCCLLCWAVQWSWFARVNALCNLSRKKRSQRHFLADFWVGGVSRCV